MQTVKVEHLVQFGILSYVSLFICIGLEGKAIPQKPETEYVECIRYFQNNKIEEPTNEDGSRLCAKYLKEQKDAK